MTDRSRDLVVGLAGLQCADVLFNRVFPESFGDAHLDHLAVPQYLRPLLSPVKVASSAGLVAGLRLPRLGALTASGLIAYYAIAASFHVRAHDGALATLPAVLLGAAATTTLFTRFQPALRANMANRANIRSERSEP